MNLLVTDHKLNLERSSIEVHIANATAYELQSIEKNRQISSSMILSSNCVVCTNCFENGIQECQISDHFGIGKPSEVFLKSLSFPWEAGATNVSYV